MRTHARAVGAGGSDLSGLRAIDGADQARRFLNAHGVTGEEADRVWTAIALHTTPEIPLHMAPEIALVTRGVELDVLGIGYHAVSCVPGFVRGDFVEVIRDSAWPE